jgi:hypothetical protein
MSEHLGRGPEGSNPLGFLCAIGAFNTLSRALPHHNVRMRWGWHTGWKPLWSLDGHSTDQDLLNAIAANIGDGSEFLLGDNLRLKISQRDFRVFLLEALNRGNVASNRRRADILAAYGSEQTTGSREIRPTALCLTHGQAHQNFLESIRLLAAETSKEDLSRALFLKWRYEDDGRKRSFRWDPLDDRRYALRATDPSDSVKAPLKIVRGANRLAFEALPLFPTVPADRSIHTTAFVHNAQEVFFRWPLWKSPIRLDSLRSLLTLHELYDSSINPAILSARGLAALYQSRRFNVRQLTNLAPAAALWERWD